MRGPVPGGVGGGRVSAGTQGFPVFTDARGELLAVEGADVGFPIARVFTVRGTDERSPRGGHVAGCRELLVLVAGRVSGTVLGASGRLAFDLTAPGESLHVGPSDLIDYALDADSVLLVLCDRPFEERP